jgi:hypothetical protein
MMDAVIFWDKRKMLCAVVDSVDAERWWKFELEDAHLLISKALPFNAAVIWVLSLNHRSELWDMLETIGELMDRFETRRVVFRTDNESALKWARRFEAIPCGKKGHRTRFYLNSIAFESVCLNAWRRRLAQDIRGIRRVAARRAVE